MSRGMGSSSVSWGGLASRLVECRISRSVRDTPASVRASARLRRYRRAEVFERALDRIHGAFDRRSDSCRATAARRSGETGVFGDLRLGTRLHGRFTGESPSPHCRSAPG